MKLTKLERATLREMFAGCCAYCGCSLSDQWHSDHVEAVQRELAYVRGKGFVPTGEVAWPDRDCIQNLMPACPPCNIDKHSLTSEQWRAKLQNTVGVLMRNQPTFRHALRFGLVAETGAQVTFHFERVAASMGGREG